MEQLYNSISENSIKLLLNLSLSIDFIKLSKDKFHTLSRHKFKVNIKPLNYVKIILKRVQKS